MTSKSSSRNTRCIILATGPDSEIFAVQVVAGTLQIDDELRCLETGLHYRVVSFGLIGNPAARENGREVVLLWAVDESAPKDALGVGMQLVACESKIEKGSGS